MSDTFLNDRPQLSHRKGVAGLGCFDGGGDFETRGVQSCGTKMCSLNFFVEFPRLPGSTLSSAISTIKSMASRAASCSRIASQSSTVLYGI